MSLERSSLKKSRRISSNFSRDFASSSSNSDEKHLIKKRKKKHKKRKFKKPRTKSFTPETNRFCVVNQEDQFKWELLNAMAEYANNHLNIFIQEQDLKQAILKTIPVPSNLQEVRRMDEFMTQLRKRNDRKSYFIEALFMRKSKEKTQTLWDHCVNYGKVQKQQIKSKNHLFLSMI